MTTCAYMSDKVFSILLCFIFLGFDAIFIYSCAVYCVSIYSIYNIMSLACSILLFSYTVIVQLFVLSLYKKAVERTIDLDGHSIEHVIISTHTHFMLEALKLGGIFVLSISLFHIGFTFADPMGEYFCYCKASISDTTTTEKFSMYTCDAIAWFFILIFFRKVF